MNGENNAKLVTMVPCRRGRSIAICLVKAALLAVVLWYVGGALYRGIREVHWDTVDIRWAWVGLSIPFIAASILVLSLAQREIYARFGQPLTISQSVGLYAVPQLGKYLPGKVMTIAGHVGIARSFGVPIAVSGSAVLLLQVLVLASATTLGLTLLLVQPGQNLQTDLVMRLMVVA